MTDAEINLAIAKIEWGDDFLDDDYLASLYECVDYVYNWADIGPIIDYEKIELRYIGPNWMAQCAYDVDIDARADTPTKAAALCYLKMNGVEI
jgi:hypothetical protein